ncbi:MAG: NAD-dependent epimerase/dehydratase family protein [Pseudobdellovibrio sp.]
MKAIVTGANGFLGSWLCKHLLEAGHDVTALVRQKSDLSEIEHLKLNYLYGDVTDKPSLKDAFKDKDYVFHLAGVIAYKARDRELMNKVNIQGTQNVVDVLSEQKNAKLLNLSSVVAIGASHTPQVLNENSPYTIHDLNLGYFETKHEAEKIVTEAALSKKIHAINVNPSTIYGFGDARKGSRKTQLQVARGKFPFYTKGGVNVVAIEDVVQGIMLAVNKGQNGERYILCGDNLTIKQLFTKIANFSGVKSPSIYMPFPLLKMIGKIGDITGNGLSVENAYTASMYHWFSCEKAWLQSQLF